MLIAGNWACQLEVDFFKEKLAGLGYELRVLTRPFGELPKTNSNGRPIIHLYNPNNVHFQHFRYINTAEARPAGGAPVPAFPSRLPVGSFSPVNQKSPSASAHLLPSRTVSTYATAAAAARKKGGTRRKMTRSKKSRKH